MTKTHSEYWEGNFDHLTCSQLLSPTDQSPEYDSRSLLDVNTVELTTGGWEGHIVGDSIEDRESMEFHQKNSERIELLARKFAEKYVSAFQEEQDARLRIREQQCDLLNLRYTEEDMRLVDTLVEQIDALSNFQSKLK